MAKLTKNEKNGFFSSMISSISKKKRRAELSATDATYPFLSKEMITPPDEELSTRDAVKIYKQHMLAIGYLEKSELSDFVTSFKEDIQNHEQELKDEAKWAKDTLVDTQKESKSEIKKLKKLISKSRDEAEKTEFIKEMGSVENETVGAVEEFELHTTKHAMFKNDKRTFLVDYVNSEVHGPAWREKLRVV